MDVDFLAGSQTAILRSVDYAVTRSGLLEERLYYFEEYGDSCYVTSGLVWVFDSWIQVC